MTFYNDLFCARDIAELSCYIKQAHLGMWDLRRRASVDSKSLNTYIKSLTVQDAQQTHLNV